MTQQHNKINSRVNHTDPKTDNIFTYRNVQMRVGLLSTTMVFKVQHIPQSCYGCLDMMMMKSLRQAIIRTSHSPVYRRINASLDLVSQNMTFI